MMKFAKCLIPALLLCLTFPGLRGAVKTQESLKYDVYYHWGFIWKKAGSGILTLDSLISAHGGPQLRARLAGRSLSIVETIMKVRDTLESYMNVDYVPFEYIKKTNEGSYFATEHNYYNYIFSDPAALLTPANIDSTIVDIHRWRYKKGNDHIRLSVAGPGYDMLSIFYVMRHLNFDRIAPGTRFQYPIFSGIKMTWMYVEYRGHTTCEMKDGKRCDSHRVELYFKSRDSDHTPLQVWLSTDSSHKPLKVIISLKRIGAIQGELVE